MLPYPGTCQILVERMAHANVVLVPEASYCRFARAWLVYMWTRSGGRSYRQPPNGKQQSAAGLAKGAC